MKKIFFILTALLLQFRFVNAQTLDYSSFIEKYSRKFKNELSANDIAGLSIAVVDGGSTVWSAGFGYYNKQDTIGVSGNTPFLIGSITKTFTALAIMQLYENGIIDIDAPLRKYLPEFQLKQIDGNDQNVTVRQLMTHHGGIPDFLSNKHPKKQLEMDLILDYINRDYATYPPNTIYSYTNSGIGLLGILIEKVTNQTFPDYIKTHILNPLHMNSSGIFSFSDMPLSVSLGYNSNLSEENEYPGIITPSGGIYSSSSDMANYIKLWLKSSEPDTKKIISIAAIDEMIKTQNEHVVLDLGLQIGLVWNILYNQAGRCIEHEGGTLWHRSEICIAPEAGLGIVILTNSLKGNSMASLSKYEMLEELIKIKGCDTSQFSIEPKYKSNHKFSLAENPEIIPEKMSYEEKVRLSGSYGTFGEIIKIEMKDSCLFTHYYGHDLYLLPVNNSEFVVSPTNDYSLANPGNRFFFEKFNNVLNLIEIDRNGSFAHYGERIEPVEIPATWKAQSGSYEILPDDNISSPLSDFNLTIEDGFMVLNASLTQDFGVPDPVIPLKIINDSLAVVYGYGRFGGQSLQILIKNHQKILRFMNQDLILKKELTVKSQN
jgi:CubicO group peptidase (beta-lactamase class C family)